MTYRIQFCTDPCPQYPTILATELAPTKEEAEMKARAGFDDAKQKLGAGGWRIIDLLDRPVAMWMEGVSDA